MMKQALVHGAAAESNAAALDTRTLAAGDHAKDARKNKSHTTSAIFS
jgi:hypothetical protein